MSYVDTIIERFGTQSALADALGIRQSAVAAWKKRGSIPSRQQQEILKAARHSNVKIEPADFFPRDEEAA